MGSNAELMGGLAGRADALFGAVECQKSNGSLHFHFFAFVQRVHQYATMKEIAELLEEKLVDAADLKHFLSNICCESYADVEKHQKEVPTLEEHFPTYSEITECAGNLTWGRFKLGRLPSELYADAAETLSIGERPGSFVVKGSSKQTDDALSSSDREVFIEAAAYKTKFEEVFQYFQSHCQHHIHKLPNGKRVVPNACRSKSKPSECKHGAPWTNRVSPEWMTQPLLVCKGIAKKFSLRCSGMRNWTGQMLGMRNDEWLNGTMPGLCVAFAGSNTDVKPNDRLPIIACTHEKVCPRKCVKVKKRTLTKTARAIERMQSVTNGYFGGYIGKRQPTGSLEFKKCIDKFCTLRSKMAGQGKTAQLRAASQRLMTEIEMNSTYRGAVEVFNLCRNLHPNDVLCAECFRTFNSANIDGRSWMYRLTASQLSADITTCTAQSLRASNEEAKCTHRSEQGE